MHIKRACVICQGVGWQDPLKGTTKRLNLFQGKLKKAPPLFTFKNWLAHPPPPQVILSLPTQSVP